MHRSLLLLMGTLILLQCVSEYLGLLIYHLVHALLMPLMSGLFKVFDHLLRHATLWEHLAAPGTRCAIHVGMIIHGVNLDGGVVVRRLILHQVGLLAAVQNQVHVIMVGAILIIVDDMNQARRRHIMLGLRLHLFLLG